MFFARLTLASTLLLGTLTAVPATARGQTARRLAQGESSTRTALVAERQRVGAELERANADIDALKRAGRGLREDYRLRERLADAEALARRLTELDSRLGTRAAPARGLSEEPRASATDGPAELDAKADILADQAQRLTARGDALLGRARDLRARQTLRRRVGQMERDPFSPLEGSKRRAMTGSAVAGVVANVGPPARGGSTQPPQSPEKAVAGAGPGTLGTPATDVSQPAAPAPGSGIGSATASGPTAGQAISSAPAAPAPTSVAAAEAGALSMQLRDLLDPATLAEIQHLEAASGGSNTGFDALERAGVALKVRAERLRQQAAALRASEHAPPRAR